MKKRRRRQILFSYYELYNEKEGGEMLTNQSSTLDISLPNVSIKNIGIMMMETEVCCEIIKVMN